MSPAPAAPPATGLCDQLAALVPRLARFISSHLESVEPVISLTQVYVLRGVAQGTTRNVDLAQRALVSEATMSGIVDRLVSLGALARASDPRDGRACRLSLTPTGRLLLTDRTTRIERALECLLGPEQLGSLRAIEGAVHALHAALDHNVLWLAQRDCAPRST